MSSAAVDALLAANPFPGLRAFRPTEADRFFGRRQQIDELVERLREARFIAVSGASGCGKSSLVLAGLLQALKRRHDEDFDTDWRAVVLRPGHRPIGHLAAALADALPSAPLRDQPSAPFPSAPLPSTPRPSAPLREREAAVDDPALQRYQTLYGQLRLGGLGLAEAVRNARLAAGTRVLVVVDQFEEIFRFRRIASDAGADEAAAFVKLLLQAAADPDGVVNVIITLRSDTLGGCADFRDLPEAVSRGGYLVPRLKREQRKEAIVRPVELRGARIAPRLVQRLLNDVSDDFDDLPVMQHALSRTWAQWAQACGGNRAIDLEDYAATGGAAQALDNHADEAWQSLGALGAPGGTVERVFRTLTERVAEGTEVRRPLQFSQLQAICGGGTAEGDAAVTQVVERYRRADTAFLVPGAERPLADDPVIDISHESLIRQWSRLRGWVRAEVEAATELEALAREAAAHAQQQGELRHGLDLARARAWQQHNRPNAAWLRLCLGGTADAAQARLQGITSFLDAGTAAERKARIARRWRRGGIAALVLGVVGVSVAAAVIGQALQRQARSRELVSRAVLAQAQDPVRSARLALGALAQDSANPRADYALRQAMAALEVARTEQWLALDEPLTEVRATDDGQQLLVAGGRSLWLLDATSLKVQRKQTAAANVLRAWVLAGQTIAHTDDNRVRLLAPDGTQRADLSCPGVGGAVAGVAYSAARGTQPAQLAVGCYNGALLLWDLGPQGVLAQLALRPGDDRSATLNALVFSGDGALLATGDADGSVTVWKRGHAAGAWLGMPARQAMGHGRAVRDLAFHPTDNSLLATASDDASARVWVLDLDARRLARTEGPNPWVLPHDRPVLGVRFVQRADDKHLLMTRSDKRVVFWSDPQTFDSRPHADVVTDASPSADGELLVSASADGTAQLWSSRAASALALLRGHTNEVTRAVFGPDGNTVLTVSRDRTLRRWRLQRPVMLAAGRSRQLAAALDPRHPRAVLCGEPAASPSDNPPSPCRISPLADLATRGNSDGEWLALPEHSEVARAGFSADGARVLGVSRSRNVDGTTRPVLWDAASRQPLTPAWLDAWAWAAFAPGRAELVTLRPPTAPGAPEELALWPQVALDKDHPGVPLLALKLADGHVSTAALSADGRWLAAARADHVLLWDRRAPTAAPRELRGHAGDLRDLVFSADSRVLATASSDRSVRLWSMAAPADAGGTPVLLQGGHAGAVTTVAFSPDGRQVLTGSTDGSIRLWDAASGRELAAVPRHADAVTAVQFGADGRQLLSASTDGTVRFDPCEACSLPADALQARARDAVNLAGPPAAEDAAALAPPSWLPRWLGGR